MTDRSQEVRVFLYGCAHKPKVSAMRAVKRGDQLICFACRKTRIVSGVETTWKRASIACTTCAYNLVNDGKLNRHQLYNLAHKHADVRRHNVSVIHDDKTEVIKPQPSQQLFLVDDDRLL